MRWVIVIAAAAAVLGAAAAFLVTGGRPVAPRPVSCHQIVAGPVPSPASSFDRTLEHAPPLCG